MSGKASFWTIEKDAQLYAMDGLAHRYQAKRLGVSVEAIKQRRRHLMRKGLLPGWRGSYCACGQPAVAKGKCHNHYEQSRQRRIRIAAWQEDRAGKRAVVRQV